MNKFLFFSTALLVSQSYALPVCKNLFLQTPAVSAMVHIDATKQWLEWEQKSNFITFRKSSIPFFVPQLSVDRSAVFLAISADLPKNLYTLIRPETGTINWFKHPYNQSPQVPYFEKTSTDSLETYQTSSRSLAVILDQNVFTLKMGTDHPHGPQGEYQPNKASTREDINDGIGRMTYISNVESKIGSDPTLILAKEVAMVADKKTGEGYLFRDVSFMNDGNYYLPALSIPYAGREIAKIHNTDPNIFWEKHYAAALGRAKAKLLLRYGLQMETPNSQNILIQLDVNLMPTGVLVFRDISDTVLIKSVAEGLGEKETLEADKAHGIENSYLIKPFWQNSAWRFNEAGVNSFSTNQLIQWGLFHDEAYKKEIEKELSINLRSYLSVEDNPKFNMLMNSDIIKARLLNYRKILSQKHSQKPLQRVSDLQ